MWPKEVVLNRVGFKEWGLKVRFNGAELNRMGSNGVWPKGVVLNRVGFKGWWLRGWSLIG